MSCCTLTHTASFKNRPYLSCTISHDLMATLDQRHICPAFKHRAPEVDKALLQADPDGSPFTTPPSLLMQQQPASEGSTAVHSTVATVQPVHNFLEDRHASHGQAVCDTAPNTAGSSNHDRPKLGKHSPRTVSIADAAAPSASSDMTLAEEEETSSCRQQSSSSAPPHRADANASASPDHTVKKEEDFTRSRDLSMNNNAAGASSDHTADKEEEWIGKTDRGLPANGCFAPWDYVPADVIAKWGHVLDIVTPQSTVTNCFTKTYSRFAKVLVPRMQHAFKCAQQ